MFFVVVHVTLLQLYILWLPSTYDYLVLFYFQEFPPSDEELEAYRNGQVKNYYIRFIYNLSWGINLWRLNEHCLDDEVDRIFLRIFLKPNCFSLVTQVGIRTRWKPFLKVLPHCYKLLHNSGPIRMQAFFIITWTIILAIWFNSDIVTFTRNDAHYFDLELSLTSCF